MGGGAAFDEAGDVVPAILRQHARDAAHQAFAKETASVIGSCRDAMQRFPAESLKLAITVRRTTSGPGAGPGRRSGHGDRRDGEAPLVSVVLPEEDEVLIHQRGVPVSGLLATHQLALSLPRLLIGADGAPDAPSPAR